MTKPKRKTRLKKSQAIIFFLSLCFITGTIAGIFSALTMNEQNALRSIESIVNYINRINLGETSPPIIIFVDSLIKHGTTALLIWVLALIKFGGLIILPAFMLTGARYGFSTALLIKTFGFRGLIYAAFIYLPQAMILIPCYFLLSYCGINFSLTSITKNGKFYSEIKNYAFKLLIALLLIMLVSGLDVLILNFVEGRLM
ncbi:MAG: stage II sporulation protein M [Defluviitaleaceae bacterium]|nr:stage II sporulation protein M [Defluviitaleaceae bacterium]